MPRVHFVKKARKDNPVAKKGESYYWWKFAFSGRSFSKTRPKQSQLTRSEFMGEYLSMGEDFEEQLNNTDTLEGVQDAVENLTERIEQLRDETQEKLDNMPEPLQEADTGQLMQERIDGLDDWLSEVEGVDLEDFEHDDETIPKNEAEGEWLTEKSGELLSTDPGLY